MKLVFLYYCTFYSAFIQFQIHIYFISGMYISSVTKIIDVNVFLLTLRTLYTKCKQEEHSYDYNSNSKNTRDSV